MVLLGMMIAECFGRATGKTTSRLKAAVYAALAKI
jgi:hypothetical protein